MTTRVMINGASGKMGQVTVSAIEQANDFELVAGLSHGDDLKDAIQEYTPEIVIDFTAPEVAYSNTRSIIESNVHPVIGTTGFKNEEIKELTQLSNKNKLGGMIVPNFAIGVVLMMQLSQQAAKYFENIEIIEMHHEQKKDAPSGTAIKTAEMIQTVQSNKQDIPIHSVRLPGLVAHQHVIFGGHGETLTIKHDTLSREAFMPGVLMACRKVRELDTLVYGLEHIL